MPQEQPYISLSSSYAVEHLLQRFARFSFFFEILLRQVVQTDPRRSHFVDRSLSPCDLRIRIRIELICGGVVMPGNGMQNRSRRQQWRGIVVVDVVDVPVEIKLR